MQVAALGGHLQLHVVALRLLSNVILAHIVLPSSPVTQEQVFNLAVHHAAAIMRATFHK